MRWPDRQRWLVERRDELPDPRDWTAKPIRTDASLTATMAAPAISTDSVTNFNRRAGAAPWPAQAKPMKATPIKPESYSAASAQEDADDRMTQRGRGDPGNEEAEHQRIVGDFTDEEEEDERVKDRQDEGGGGAVPPTGQCRHRGRDEEHADQGDQLVPSTAATTLPATGAIASRDR